MKLSSHVIWVLTTSAALLSAQENSASNGSPHLPLIAGGMVEMGAGVLPDGSASVGLVRITPYLGGWIDGLGYAKVAYSQWSHQETDSSGASKELESKVFGLQIGVSLGGPSKPYLIGSYTRSARLSELGDATWSEWGMGLGAYLALSPYAALVPELEIRNIGLYYDPTRNSDIEGSRLQFNLGFVVFLY